MIHECDDGGSVAVQPRNGEHHRALFAVVDQCVANRHREVIAGVTGAVDDDVAWRPVRECGSVCSVATGANQQEILAVGRYLLDPVQEVGALGRRADLQVYARIGEGASAQRVDVVCGVVSQSALHTVVSALAGERVVDGIADERLCELVPDQRLSGLRNDVADVVEEEALILASRSVLNDGATAPEEETARLIGFCVRSMRATNSVTIVFERGRAANQLTVKEHMNDVVVLAAVVGCDHRQRVSDGSVDS